MPDERADQSADRWRQEINRTVPPDQARRYVDAPIADQERESVWELVRWFTRRYPTPLARLQYVRRAHARWIASRPSR
jgi:hypothetical protein